MKELDDLKDLWQSQNSGTSKIGPVEESLSHRLEKQRKKIRRTNIAATLWMLVTSVYLAFIMFSYPEESYLFYLSVSLVILLMIVVVFILWRRSLLGGDQLAMDSQSYIRYQLRRLKRNRLIIECSPLYGLALGVLINAYAYSLIENASKEFVFWLTNINWFYIVAAGFLSYRYKMRKFKSNMEPLIRELEELDERLNARIN